MPGDAPGAAPTRTRADPALVKAVARAIRYQRMLDEGRYASISEMASGEWIERGYLGTLLRLTLLAPDIVEAILDGRQPAAVTLPALMKPFPVGWPKQRAAWRVHGPRPDRLARGSRPARAADNVTARVRDSAPADGAARRRAGRPPSSTRRWRRIGCAPAGAAPDLADQRAT
jgi:hypothetical protein